MGKKSTRSIAPNNPLVKNSCNPSFTKLSKLSNDFVLESIAPAGNQFLKSFLLNYHRIRKLSYQPHDQVFLIVYKKIKKKKKKSLLDHFKVP